MPGGERVVRCSLQGYDGRGRDERGDAAGQAVGVVGLGAGGDGDQGSGVERAQLVGGGAFGADEWGGGLLGG